MINYALECYSTTFREIQAPVQCQKVNNFQASLPTKLTELSSKPFLFQINDFVEAMQHLERTNCYNRFQLPIIVLFFKFLIVHLLIIHILNIGN
jgi:hypothetical protein